MPRNLSNNQLLLKECIRQEYEEMDIYDNENSFFEYFASLQVLKDYDLSDDEIASGIIGGGNDGGCDGMYIFLNNDFLTQDQIENLSAPKSSVLELTIIRSKKQLVLGNMP